MATTLSPELETAIEHARRETGLRLPVESPGVWSAPYEYESRLQRPDALDLQRLGIFVPERHDLALMKLLRCYQHDLEVIAEMHERDPLDLRILVRRFQDERGHVVGRPETHRTSLLLVVETLFGEEAAEKVEAELPTNTGPPRNGD